MILKKLKVFIYIHPINVLHTSEKKETPNKNRKKAKNQLQKMKEKIIKLI